jgi:hypothetical protein
VVSSVAANNPRWLAPEVILHQARGRPCARPGRRASAPATCCCTRARRMQTSWRPQALRSRCSAHCHSAAALPAWDASSCGCQQPAPGLHRAGVLPRRLSGGARARAQRYSKAADVFSFAVVLWELAVWRLPWEDLGPFQARAPPSATVGPRRGLVPAAAAIAIFLPRACFSEGGRLM